MCDASRYAATQGHRSTHLNCRGKRWVNVPSSSTRDTCGIGLEFTGAYNNCPWPLAAFANLFELQADCQTAFALELMNA